MLFTMFPVSLRRQLNGSKLSIIKLLVLCCLAVFLLPVEMLAAENPSSDLQFTQDEKSNDPVVRLWDDLWTLPEVILDESGEIISVEVNSFFLLAAGGASIAMHSNGTDKKIADNFDRHGIMNNDADKFVDFLGGPGFHFAATGLWYLSSAGKQDFESNERSWTMLKALSTNGAITLALKAIRNNKTPNGKNLAWPSGHTSSSFTAAAVLDEFYGPEIGIPAYIGAGFVGYRMMDTGDHWASDVVFGGVLGYIVGHHFGAKHNDLQVGDFKVIPMASFDENPGMGVGLYKKF